MKNNILLIGKILNSIFVFKLLIINIKIKLARSMQIFPYKNIYQKVNFLFRSWSKPEQEIGI